MRPGVGTINVQTSQAEQAGERRGRVIDGVMILLGIGLCGGFLYGVVAVWQDRLAEEADNKTKQVQACTDIEDSSASLACVVLQTGE